MIIRIEQVVGQQISTDTLTELLDMADLVIVPVGYRFPSSFTPPETVCQLDSGAPTGVLVLTSELGLPDLTIEQLRRQGWCLPFGTVDELTLSELCRLSLYQLPDDFTLPVQLGIHTGQLTVRAGRPVVTLSCGTVLTPSVWAMRKLLLATAVAPKPAGSEPILTELTAMLNRLVPVAIRRR